MTFAVLCVMGLPASGKTTLCRLLQETDASVLGNISLGYPCSLVKHISFDELENAEKRSNTCVFDPAAWRRARQRAFDDFDRLRSQVESEQTSMTLVLLDDNFFYKSMRKRFRPHGIIFLNRGVDECITLNRQRGRPLPDSLIENMAILLEIPEPSQNTSVLTIPATANDGPEDIVRFVLESRGFWSEVFLRATSPSIPPLDDKRTYSNPSERENALDELEKQLRRCVSRLATETRLPPEIIKKVSLIKQELVARCKRIIRTDSTEDEIDEIIESAVVEFNSEIAKL